MRKIVLTTIVTVSVMAGLGMSAASGELADDASQCKQLHYKPGTALFLQCLTLYQQQRAQAQARAQAASDAEQAAATARRAAQCSALMNQPGPPMGIMEGYDRAELEAQCAR